MRLAVNYSRPLVKLIREGAVQIDLIKCPAWPALIDEALEVAPCYVHTPLVMGSGKGPLDSETGLAPDWDGKIANVLARTGTDWVGVHFIPELRDYPAMSVDSDTPAACQRVIENTLRDLEVVLAHFPADRVLLENIPGHHLDVVRPGILPEVITAVIERAGIGLLLDISHAHMTANFLGIDTRDYLSCLPVDRIGELHFAGVHRMEGRWLEIIRAHDPSGALVEEFAGHLQDHLPMTEADFTLLAWVLERIGRGEWAEPRVISFEYGAVDSLFEHVTFEDVLAEQVPRLYRLVHPDRV